MNFILVNINRLTLIYGALFSLICFVIMRSIIPLELGWQELVELHILS